MSCRHKLYVVPAGDKCAEALIENFKSDLVLEQGFKEIVHFQRKVLSPNMRIYGLVFGPIGPRELSKAAVQILEDKCPRESSVLILGAGAFSLVSEHEKYSKLITVPLERRYEIEFLPFRRSLEALYGEWFIMNKLEGESFELVSIKKENSVIEQRKLSLQ